MKKGAKLWRAALGMVIRGHVKTKHKASSQTCPQEQLGESLLCWFWIGELKRSLQFILSLSIISSLSCKQPIGYYCVDHCLSILLSVRPPETKFMHTGDTAKTTRPIYFILSFMARSFWIHNARLFHFLKFHLSCLLKLFV